MKIEISSDPNLTILIVSGDLFAEEIIREIDHFYATSPTTNVLWDLSRARFNRISSADVERIVRVSRKYAQRRESGKTALVFSADEGFGLGRMFGILQEIEGSPVQHRSFRSRQEAMDWFGQ